MSTVPFTRARQVPLPNDLREKLPTNVDAERSILGGILLDNKSVTVALKELKANDFSVPENQIIFHMMAAIAEEQTANEEPLAIDLVILSERLAAISKLEAAGGAVYIASLVDGMARVTNVAHYAKIVREKSQLRKLMHFAYNLQVKAAQGRDGEEEGSDSIFKRSMEEFAAIREEKPSDESPIVVVPYSELLTLELPKADPLIEPLVTRAGTFMIFSWAGWGKSWLATHIAFCVAHGIDRLFAGHEGPGGHWPICGAMRTLYLYGEMHGEKIRERLKLIGKNLNVAPDFTGLATISKDYQRIARAPRAAHGWRPGIKEPKDRRHIEELLSGEGYKFLVLDNISTLWSAAQEDQSRQTAELKEWFIDLNTRGITVCFLQHAGKGGDFLGDSAQVHILDSYIKLEHPGDYRRSQGLRVVVNLEKIRHELRDPHWGVPFEAQLCTSPENGAEWLTRPAMKAMKKVAFEMFSNGAPPTEVLRSFSILKRPTLYRWHHEWKEKLSSDTTSSDDEEQ